MSELPPSWNALGAAQEAPQPMMVDEAMKEVAFEREVVRYARQRGWLVHYDIPSYRRGMLRTQQGGDNGYPDVTLARGGVVLHCELKAQKGSFVGNQKRWRDAIGASWRGWKPRDVATIVAELR